MGGDAGQQFGDEVVEAAVIQGGGLDRHGSTLQLQGDAQLPHRIRAAQPVANLHPQLAGLIGHVLHIHPIEQDALLPPFQGLPDAVVQPSSRGEGVGLLEKLLNAPAKIWPHQLLPGAGAQDQLDPLPHTLLQAGEVQSAGVVRNRQQGPGEKGGRQGHGGERGGRGRGGGGAGPGVTAEEEAKAAVAGRECRS